MPTRLLRDGILSSERINKLDSAGEVFYRRLMSKVDDYGCFDGRPSILRAELFPLRVDRVREADISRWMAECQKAGLIVLYEADGKPYLQMLDTGWQQRSKPKYPLPTDSNCKQLETTAHLVVDVVRSRSRSTNTGRKRPLPPDFEISDRVKEWALQEKYTDLDEHMKAFKLKCAAKGYEYADWDAAFMEAVRKDWAGIRSQSKTTVNGAPWWSSDSSIEAKGREIGMAPRAGESWQQFRGRIQQRLEAS